MFISKAFGGRVSDTFIVEKSGFMNYLFPGDEIMADRGFTTLVKCRGCYIDKEDCQGVHSCGKGHPETQSVQDLKWYCACGIFKTV